MAELTLHKTLNDMKQSNDQRRNKQCVNNANNNNNNINQINIDNDDALNESANNDEKDFVCLTYSSSLSSNVVRFAPVDCCSLNTYSSTSSTSSDHLNLVESHSNQFCLAFDNLTYFSSIESDLPQHINKSQSVEFNLTKQEEADLGLQSSENESDQDEEDEFNMEMKQGTSNGQTSESALKKTLKSIKRKDKLKKGSSACTFATNNAPNEMLTEDDDDEMLFDKNKISFQLTIVNKPLSSSSSPASSSSSSGLKKTKSMPDLTQLQSEDQTRLDEQQKQQREQEDVMISNSEYEKQLKKLLRNKSFSRSLRRAKTVYYRNRRSKSIEDLSVEERNTYLARINSNLNLNLLKHKRNSTVSIDSSSSNGLASDISSSYFHELSDWSPEFNSSNSESSQEELFHNVDWDAKFSSMVFSEYNSSSEEEEEEKEMPIETKFKKEQSKPAKARSKPTKQPKCNQFLADKIENLSNQQANMVLNEFLKQSKLNANSEVIEKMLNEVMSRMLNMHPKLETNNQNANETSSHDLSRFRIDSHYLSAHSPKDCALCMAKFELDDDVASFAQSCEHVFHSVCIQVSFSSKWSGCPICNKQPSASQRVSNFVQEGKVTNGVIKRETLL